VHCEDGGGAADAIARSGARDEKVS